MSNDELRVVDSPPFQRLRHIRQLALSNLVYPGAMHTRFEHSLGVMELAGRVFDVVTRDDNLHDEVRKQFSDELTPENKAFWRRNLRFAALCHDLGHPPFSHAGEDLLPEGWTMHDSVSVALTIKDGGMLEVWRGMAGRRPDAEEVAQIAVGFDTDIWKPLEKSPEGGPWLQVLSKIITDAAFGVDRMDYLLRDAYYTGVSNGVFDYRQLTEALRLLPTIKDSGEESGELSLGLVRNGLHSAEAMAVARYLMYRQVYYHRTRRIYDFHLKQFLKAWLPGGTLPVNPEDHLRLADPHVWTAIMEAAKNSKLRGHAPARRIIERNHLKLAYEHWPQAGNFSRIVSGAKKNFSADFSQGKIIIIEKGLEMSAPNEEDGIMPSFPVLFKDGALHPSERVSDILFRSGGADTSDSNANISKKILRPSFGYVFADRDIVERVEEWFKKKTGNPGKEKK